jgi:hypothetical protein
MAEPRPIRDTPANRRQLGVITKSTLFRRRQKLIALLEYLAGETMAGREADLTQQKIAAHAFNVANPADAQAGVTVRTAAARLRTALDEYYRTQAAPSEIRITMPPRRFYIAAEPPEPSVTRDESRERTEQTFSAPLGNPNRTLVQSRMIR